MSLHRTSSHSNYLPRKLIAIHLAHSKKNASIISYSYNSLSQYRSTKEEDKKWKELHVSMEAEQKDISCTEDISYGIFY